MFRTAFKQIFGELLNDYGYSYNGKYAMFMRVVGDELIQYITYKTYSSIHKGYKCFTIYAGVSSIYNYSVTNEALLSNANVLDQIDYYYFQRKDHIDGYYYNDQNMISIIEETLNRTIEVLIPVFDQVNDLDSYLAYIKKTGTIGTITKADEFEKYKNDALVLIKADNHDGFRDFYHREIEQVRKMYANGQIGGALRDQEDLIYNVVIKNVVDARDHVYQDNRLLEAVMSELVRRGNANIQYLLDCKVIK